VLSNNLHQDGHTSIVDDSIAGLSAATTLDEISAIVQRDVSIMSSNIFVSPSRSEVDWKVRSNLLQEMSDLSDVADASE
jgi:hypothetical protein